MPRSDHGYTADDERTLARAPKPPVSVEPPRPLDTLVEPKGPAAPARPVAPPATDAEIYSPDRIVTARLTIRPLDASDRAAYVAALTRSREQLEAALPMFAPGESPAAAFERHLAQADEGRRGARAWRRVAEDRTGRLVGGVAIRGIERGLSHRGEFVVWVDDACSGAGFATEMARAAVRFAALPLPEGLGLDRVLALALPHNTASRRMLAAAGFERCASEDSDVELNGRLAPHVAYAFEAPIATF